MNSIAGIIQKLAIVQQTKTKLVLRELPLLDWSVAFGLVMTALMLSIAEFWWSAAIAAGVGFYFILAGRVRMIHFDVSSGMMITTYQTPIRQTVVSELDLDTIQRAYLFKGEDGGTQIILVRRDGEELGLSVYSSDLATWKDDIVIAINAILYEAHKEEIKDN